MAIGIAVLCHLLRSSRPCAPISLSSFSEVRLCASLQRRAWTTRWRPLRRAASGFAKVGDMPDLLLSATALPTVGRLGAGRERFAVVEVVYDDAMAGFCGAWRAQPSTVLFEVGGLPDLCRTALPMVMRHVPSRTPGSGMGATWCCRAAISRAGRRSAAADSGGGSGCETPSLAPIGRSAAAALQRRQRRRAAVFGSQLLRRRARRGARAGPDRLASALCGRRR